MGATDIVLQWGEGNSLVEIEGIIEVDDLAVGTAKLVYVDHSAEQVFALPASPVFSLTAGDVAGITLRVVERGIIGSTAYRTDGEGFLLEVVIAADAVGADKGRGEAELDWDIHWTRRGVAL